MGAEQEVTEAVTSRAEAVTSFLDVLGSCWKRSLEDLLYFQKETKFWGGLKEGRKVLLVGGGVAQAPAVGPRGPCGLTHRALLF